MISELNGATTKLELRGYLKERLRLFVDGGAAKSHAESRMASQLIPFLNQYSGVVAGFNSLADEPSLSGLFASISTPSFFLK